MKAKEHYRGVEDPIGGTFDLAEKVSEKASKFLLYSHFALIFTLTSLFFILILAVAIKNLFVSMVLGAIFLMGFVALFLLLSLKRFLNEFSFRYSAIKAMREGPPLAKVPKGRNPTERFINHLRAANRSFDKLLKRTPEVLRKDAYVKGASGRRYHYDAFIIIRPPLLSRIIRGSGGYSLFIKELKREPGEDYIKKITEELADISRAHGVLPSRVTLIFKAPRGYAGIDEDLYRKVVDEGVYLPGKRRTRINFQIVAELEDGTYDFIPAIPDIPGVLP
ncbi:MAG: hypothetical protein DRN40_01100 [Thermoplasmata archaeon]|nr:MAG: hypothetical protein DRN40_01100 [Thermoplasmata archaeon]